MDNIVEEVFAIFQQFTDNLKIVENFEVVDNVIEGKIEIICTSKPNIFFDVRINPNYPLKKGTVESISFINVDLTKYSHINYDGSICFNTSTTPNLSYKLENDIKAVLEWVDLYYIKELNDNHFEYLYYDNQDSNQVFLFCDTDIQPLENDFGILYFTKKNNSEKQTFLTQGLKSRAGGRNISFRWSKYYGHFKDSLKGLYFISDQIPVYYRNFSFKSWDNFESTFSEHFLKFLNDAKRNIEKKDLIDGKHFILLYGYPIGNGKLNFETIKVDYYNIPVSKGNLLEKDIIWCKTVDSSYQLFFGRGKLHNNLCNGKILIIGVGAIGSNLAESLVRSGCKHVDLFDSDDKEIGNICRAKYSFFQGEAKKVDELTLTLIGISPFVEINKFNYSIVPLQTDEQKKLHFDFLNKYDYVFNCTASNDVNIILDELSIEKELITISISNNAKELVCIIENNNVYEKSSEIYSSIEQDLNDMFNPQGCWNPTFKASFHNINALVNYALSNIDYKLKNDLPLKTFMLQVEEKENYTIKLKD